MQSTDSTYNAGYPGYSADTTEYLQSIVFPSKPGLSSFFTTHTRSSGTTGPTPYQKYQPDWLLGLILLCFAIIAWIQVFYSKRFRQVLLAPYSKRFLNQLVRDGNLFKERISVALSLVYFITFSVFLFQCYIFILHGNALSHQGFPVFIAIAGIFAGYWFAKVIVIRILGNIFKTVQPTREYLLNLLIINITLGISLLPLLVLAIYLKSVFFLDLSIAVIIIFFAFRFIRGFIIGTSISKFSYLLLFVYLCSLEILPLIIIAKLAITYYDSMAQVN
jgi:hypothetical protein